MVARTVKLQQTETDIAVLQVQVNTLDSKVAEIKTDLKDLHDTMDHHSEVHASMLKEIKEASSAAHKALSDKISALEKWRWMMMGAGIVIGSLGFDTVAKLLK